MGNQKEHINDSHLEGNNSYRRMVVLILTQIHCPHYPQGQLNMLRTLAPYFGIQQIDFDGKITNLCGCLQPNARKVRQMKRALPAHGQDGQRLSSRCI